MSQPCRIIGVLDNGVSGLSIHTLSYVSNADVVIGGTRILKLMEKHFADGAQQHDLTGQLTQVPEWIQQAQNDNKRVIVLATGDPLCHGIGKYLVDKLGRDKCEILPNVSNIQILCARLGISWQDIKICSVHSKDAGEWQRGADLQHGMYSLLQAIQSHDQLAVFTSPENTPARIARMMIIERIAPEWTMTVAEKLMHKEEKLHVDLNIVEVSKQDFAEPNLILLQRKQAAARNVLFGLADDSYKQRKPEKGLITKREVRAVSLARMQLKVNSIVWDIGAASGSVGLEAARLCLQGHVYAIEKNEADAGIALDNKLSMGVTNYSLVNDKAPAQLENWPDPDAIFIGGSGGELAQLITLCLERLNDAGWLVMNFVTLENLSVAIETLKQLKVQWDVTQLSASRSQPILDMHRMAAENPVWIVSVEKTV